MSDEQYVIIESDKSRVERMPENHSLVTVEEDATHDIVLNEGGIERAKAIISTLPKDADTVYIALTARELNPGMLIIARASEEQSESKLRRAGADKVVMPDALGGIHMAHLITKPYVNEFLERLQVWVILNCSARSFRLISSNQNFRTRLLRSLM